MFGLGDEGMNLFIRVGVVFIFMKLFVVSLGLILEWFLEYFGK